MAKEKFLIVAVPMIPDCFGIFSETTNCEAIDSGKPLESAYGWIEASFEIVLIRYREATHICSFEPSAYYVWLQNAFVGIPNAAWGDNGDPAGLENESGGEEHGYRLYRDEYDSRLICHSLTIDTVKDLGIRKPAVCSSLSRRTDREHEAVEAYHKAIWGQAEETAWEIGRNGGFWCDGLDVFTYRQMQRDRRNAARAKSLSQS